VESNYNPTAVSPKGAQGLMQLIPATARRFGVSDVFDPADNIQGGAKYLRYLLDLYGGDYPLALAAYNAGEGAVAKYGTVPPYPETQNYLRLVAHHLREAAPAMAEKPQPPAAALPAPVRVDDTTHVQAVVGEDGSLHYVSQ
jgi:soluble lytic murein transglycosylase-like protein